MGASGRRAGTWVLPRCATGPSIPLSAPQVLLSLPPLVADLRRGQRRLEEEGQPLSPGSVYAALLDCLAARDNRSWGVNSITPASLKRALDARSSAFRGALQQVREGCKCWAAGWGAASRAALQQARPGRRPA